MLQLYTINLESVRMSKKKFSILLGMILLFVILRYLDISHYLSIDSLLDNREKLIIFTEKHHLMSVIIFMITNILLGALGVPVFAVYTLTAGLIFGFLEGLVLSMTASILGGYISFYLSRYALSNYFRNKYKSRLEKIESKLKYKPFTYLLGLRLLPGFPYFFTNILAGLSPIDKMTFLYSTVLGIMPSTCLFIYCGYILRRVTTIKQMLTLNNFWPVILLVLFAVTTLVIKLKKNKVI